MISADLPHESAASYRARLSPWCVVQFLPNLERSTLERFRNRSAAEEYLKVLQRMNVGSNYQIVFDLE